MKKTHIAILAAAVFMSTSLYSCSSETTTGVDTESTENELDGQPNDENEGSMSQDNVSPLDTASNATGDTTGINH
ncbi:hypothetical protein [Pontibacter oryzae]|nr:hypothetical protein [Pontibacter oryzae]